MNQRDVRAWLWMLPYSQNGTLRRCENDTERVEIIQELLKWATKDGMSDEDRVVCVEALEYLRHGRTQSELESATPVLRRNGKVWG